MQSSHFFSIIIPFYFKNSYSIFQLKRCIKSIKYQSFKDYEIVISTPNYFNELKNDVFFKETKIIRTFKKSSYIHENINIAINYSQGKWIKILFSDDYFLKSNDLKNLFIFINDTNYKWIMMNTLHRKKDKLIRPLIPYYQNQILTINTIGSPSVIAFQNKDSPLFDEKSWMRLDVDFYHRLKLKFGNPGYISNIYIVNELHANQESNVLRKISNETKIKLDNELNYLCKKYNYKYPNKLEIFKYKLYIKLERIFFKMIFNHDKLIFENLKVPLFNIF
tara:strand:- start:766 stop:1599 length:834 start_codon:yes stop_codon:yes gene_type:complete